MASRNITIYEGFWRNHRDSEAGNLVWTTTESSGRVLVAFLALFVRTAGAHLWQTINYVLHQIRSSPVPRDGLYHQQQARFRNTSSTLAAVWEHLQLALTWRNNLKFGFLRGSSFALLALTYALSLAAGGLFSSRLAYRLGDVLVSSPNCGVMRPSNRTIEDAFDENRAAAVALEDRQWARASKAYADNCYLDNADSSVCGEFTSKDLSKLSEVSAIACPFLDDICKSEGLRLDTGYINSNQHLGVQSIAKDSITYRRVAECAVLKQDGYVSGWGHEDPYVNVSSDGYYDGRGAKRPFLPGDSYKYYYYGLYPPDVFAYRSSNYSRLTSPLPYNLNTIFFIEGNGWGPIAALNTTGGVLSMIFIENLITYTSPVDDPLFEAKILAPNNGADEAVPGPDDTYAPSFDAGVVACSEKKQICNPAYSTHGEPLCSQLVALSGDQIYRLVRYEGSTLVPDKLIESLNLDQQQLTTLMRLFDTFYGDYILDLPGILQYEAMVASQSIEISGLRSASLPANQWSRELINWHKISLAGMQRAALDWAVGPSRTEFNDYVTRPNTSELEQLCHRQRAKDHRYTSFHGVGVIATLAVGLIIIVINTVLPMAIRFARLRGWIRGRYPEFTWQMDEVLQLQRSMFEAAGVRGWVSSTEGQFGQSMPRVIDDRKFERPYQASAHADTKSVAAHEVSTMAETISLVEQRDRQRTGNLRAFSGDGR
jgi:hypothetical protein